MSSLELLPLIDPTHLENLNTPNHFSLFISGSEYQILIIRGIAFIEEELSFETKNYLIDSEKRILEYSKGELSYIGKNLDKIDEVLEEILAKNEKIIDEFIKEIDRLEDSLYERKTSRIFMDNWFDLKKDLARIERYYTRSIHVINTFYKFNQKDETFPHAGFQDFMSDLGYSQHNVGNNMSKLDALYTYYGSIKNDKLNNNLYTLTVLSAIFLPLNLIVGFFGMNTENLFFKDNPHGTQNVFLILAGTFILAFLGIPVVKLIDKYFLKFLLGRSHIYKKVTSKIDKIEEILKI